LADANRFQEAATVVMEYGKRPDQAVRYWLLGSSWSDAMLTAHKFNLHDMMESTVIPALEDAYERSMNDVREAAEDFEKKKARLAVVRDSKKNMGAIDAASAGKYNLKLIFEVNYFLYLKVFLIKYIKRICTR
jgi:hypothetical protein